MVIGDPAFAAVVLCNRAAAQLGAGRFVDAVAGLFSGTAKCSSSSTHETAL